MKFFVSGMSMVVVGVLIGLAEYGFAENRVVVIPLPTSGGPPVGQVCADGEYVYGFDSKGNILCSTIIKTVFVTSSLDDGDLGGLVGADAKCQAMADTAGLSGTYKAWLSDSTSSPSTRFTHSQTPYLTTAGTVVANNWQDLTDDSLQNPINVDENGVLRDFADVMTNTKSDGTIDNPARTCDNFTSIDPVASNRVGVGFSQETRSQWTETGISFDCDIGVYRLYCFQQ